MTNNDRAEDEVALLKKEVEYLKEKLNSVSESKLFRGCLESLFTILKLDYFAPDVLSG